MTKKTKKLLAATILIFGLSNLQAQETIPATGGEATGTGSASYTVGQVVYTAHTGTNGNSIIHGVQQPFEISVVTGIPEAEGINLSISAYPNPVSDFLIISVENFELSILNIQLFDINGKLLKSKKITADKTEIATTNLTAGTYFLKVTDNKKVIKLFKIIKNK